MPVGGVHVSTPQIHPLLLLLHFRSEPVERQIVGTTVDRLNEILNPDNVTAVGDLLKNLSTLSGAFAKQDGSIQATLSELPGAIASFKQTFERLNGLSDKLGQIAMEVGPQDAETRKACESLLSKLDPAAALYPALATQLPR